MNHINKWVCDCDFSNITRPIPIMNDRKIHHTPAECPHVSRGFVTICGEDFPVEQCLRCHYPHVVMATDRASVFICATRIADEMFFTQKIR